MYYLFLRRKIEEISEASDIIALVEVDSIANSDETSGVPYTEYQMNVIDGVYNVFEGEEFIVVMTGVETDDKIIEIEDDPLMDIGAEYLIFCKENTDGTYRIISGSQGRLVYEDGKLNSLNVVDEQVANANEFSAITVENVDAQELIAEIQTYVDAE